MSDYEVRRQLQAFYGWRPRDVWGLSASEIAAWGKHIAALRQVGFWPDL